MLATTKDVAEAAIFSEFICCELKFVGDTRNILHLDHKFWNPERVNHIGSCKTKAHLLTKRHVENWWLCGSSCHRRSRTSFLIDKLPRPLDSINSDIMNFCTYRRDFYDFTLRFGGVTEENRNNDKRDDCVSNLGGDVVLELTRKSSIIFLAMKDRGPEYEN